MEKKIRTELLKMSGIIMVLLGLGVYAHEFVIAGVKAKVALNLSIFGIFGVAASIAFRHVLSLNNEVVALKALQIDYGSKSRRPTDPFVSPAIVFHEPELLGQGYRLIAEELGKQDDLQISNATVQMLLHDVDQRINERKSTILYFSGLMVFLGLLGAFMGLMKTVHSVSDLIGAMDVSGKGGTDSFGKMIDGMKAPLNGMSVGFSSSLFGLMTSMVLGALERCMTSALKSLRNEFEHWLSNVAALEGAQADNPGRPGKEFAAVRRVLEAGALQFGELRTAIQDSVRQSERVRKDIDRLTDVVSELTAVVCQIADPRPLLEPVSAALCTLARNQTDMLGNVQALQEEAAVDRLQLRASLQTLGTLVGQARQLDGAVLHRQLDQLIAVHQDAAERNSAPIPAAAEQQPRRGGAAGWLGNLLGGSWRNRPPGSQRAGLLGTDMRVGLAHTNRSVRDLADRIDERLAGLETSASLDRDMLARLDAHAQAQRSMLDQLGEHLANGDPDDAEPVATAGALFRLDLLRRRLGLRSEDTSEEPPKSAATQRRAGQGN